NGTFNWTNVIISGAGVTTVAAGATFTLAGSQPRQERVLNNGANAVLTSFSSFFINGGTFNNQNGAVFDIQANVGIFDSTPGTFSNAGNIGKSHVSAPVTRPPRINSTATNNIQTSRPN